MAISGKKLEAYQEVLNKLTKPKPLLEVDGKFGSKTKAEVRKFQKEIGAKPTGEIDESTAKALDQAVKTGKFPKDAGAKGPDAKNLSGKAWFNANQAKYPNSKSVSDLSSGFKSSAQKFIKALEDGGAKVKVFATLRSPQRAELMYYCWQVGKMGMKADKVPKIAGVDINWDHGDEKKSKAAAKEMFDAFGIAGVVAKPGKSNHLTGNAIDMNISWSGDLKMKDGNGKDVTIDTKPASERNTDLQDVGATFGCKNGAKTVNEPWHWSTTGR
ncbi:MAG: peptidoglycan-binding protein [Gemmobacter sp.]